jgi:serine/threonine protein kinase
MDIPALRNEIFKIKTIERELCNEDIKELKEDITPGSVNRKTQCALLSMQNLAEMKYGDKIGSGVEGLVSKFRINPTGEDTKIENIGLLNNTDDKMVIKTIQPTYYDPRNNTKYTTIADQDRQILMNLNRTQMVNSNIADAYQDSDVQRFEGLISLYVNRLHDYSPNFPYFYDMRNVFKSYNEDYTVVARPLDNFDYETGNYGIMTENIRDSIPFMQFLRESKTNAEYKSYIPEILNQILFSVYLAVRELGLVHFDLHAGNVLLQRTTLEEVYYNVPLTPDAYKSLYGDYEDPTGWNLEENYWIFDNELDDPDSFRVPEYMNLEKEDVQLEFCMFPNIKVGDKYHRQYKHFRIPVLTHGWLVKIIDFGFGSMYVGDEFIINKNVLERIFNNVDIDPSVPYVAFDIWRILMFVYSAISGGSFANQDLFEIFGDYATFEKIQLDTNAKTMRDLGQLKYLDRLPEHVKDNELFMNLCFVIFNEMHTKL